MCEKTEDLRHALVICGGGGSLKINVMTCSQTNVWT